MTAPGRYGLNMIYMELYPEEFLKCRNLCVDSGDRWVVSMLKQLRAASTTSRERHRIKVFCGCEPAQAVIHFKNVEDMLHWVFSHGGYVTHFEGRLQQTADPDKIGPG